MTGCSFEDVHCEVSFETDAAPGITNSWDTQECSAEGLADTFTVFKIQQGAQHIEFTIGGPPTVGAHLIELKYSDGSTRWEHDGGGSRGVGPACSVTFDSADKEEWTKTTRVRASGTIQCPGKLTNFSDEELGFLNTSFDIFASDETLLLF